MNFRDLPVSVTSAKYKPIQSHPTFKTPASESWTQGPQAYKASTAQTEHSFAFHEGF